MKSYYGSVAFYTIWTVLLLSATSCRASEKQPQGTAAHRELVDHAPTTRRIEALNTECPVCNDDDNKETNRAIHRIVSKASRLIKRTSTFGGLKRTMRTRIGRRRFNKFVSSNSTILLFNDTGSHFAALAVYARQAKIAHDHVATTSAVTSDMFGLLEDVSTVSASVAFEIGNVIRGTDRATAGLLTTSTLAIFGFFERVTLATTSLLVDYVGAALNGQSTGNVTLKLAVLQESLSTNTTNGVFGDVSDFLSGFGDKSGLLGVLAGLSMQVSGLQGRVRSLSLPTSTQSDQVYVVSVDAQKELYGLMAGVTLATANSMERITLGSLDSIGDMVSSTLGLLVQRVDSILNQSTSTINSLLSVSKADSKDNAVAGDTILLLACIGQDLGLLSGICAFLAIPGFFITLPFWFTVAVIYTTLDSIFGGGIRTDAKTIKQIGCKRDELVCQSNALSSALPSL